MAQEQSRAQAQHKQVKNKHFWTFRAAAGDSAAPELILYGDIASETWWGDEVTPRQFTEELDALGAVPEIVVRINSGGGDVFAANAIYTRLKDNAAKIIVKIDGWAASAATIVAMAGDVIEIPGNGVFNGGFRVLKHQLVAKSSVNRLFSVKPAFRRHNCGNLRRVFPRFQDISIHNRLFDHF